MSEYTGNINQLVMSKSHAECNQLLPQKMSYDRYLEIRSRLEQVFGIVGTAPSRVTVLAKYLPMHVDTSGGPVTVTFRAVVEVWDLLHTTLIRRDVVNTSPSWDGTTALQVTVGDVLFKTGCLVEVGMAVTEGGFATAALDDFQVISGLASLEDVTNPVEEILIDPVAASYTKRYSYKVTDGIWDNEVWIGASQILLQFVNT